MAMRLLAIMLNQPILVVSPWGRDGAILRIFPSTLDGTDKGMASHYQGTHYKTMFIPDIAYNPLTIVLYHNGTDHYAITWVPAPEDCDAANPEELLTAFKFVATQHQNWFVVGGNLAR
jgi:hypothetical protein